MSNDKKSPLNDEQMLFTMITALVKRDGGEIRITADEMDAVTKKDLMLMYFDKKKQEIILTTSLMNPLSEEEH